MVEYSPATRLARVRFPADAEIHFVCIFAFVVRRRPCADDRKQKEWCSGEGHRRQVCFRKLPVLRMYMYVFVDAFIRLSKMRNINMCLLTTAIQIYIPGTLKIKDSPPPPSSASVPRPLNALSRGRCTDRCHILHDHHFCLYILCVFS